MGNAGLKDIKALKEQGRWHSLDMVNEYLKNLGALDFDSIKADFPVLGGQDRYQKVTLSA